ncbi:MAG: hypothetical protein M3O90_03495 [Actinomycetota bacterium]|nr:hypothetical protein [Actinomycetota bacterium]
MKDETTLDVASVLALAHAAGLPLGGDRAQTIAPQLGEWLTAANELNRKMSRPEHRTIVPITVLMHSLTEGIEE